ncbi:hypothetical protein SAMN03159338_0699 [Sphingomonas sp. NFR04]|uniref:hypothetical protein n=1 Tax=Sphingomonas sp. NFR04 TaxID=1566283 RepID=UPI0008E41F8A|nr:hypothetical protein [Sphingomonas sp. NFR04]SFJ06308.1 hypothetical protein SAMN03159338_0699 [Sphingomonas sp. NFR04]
MPSPDDRSYFQRRARAELAIASICEDNAAALAHFRLADEYERRVRAMAPQMPSAAVGSLRG